MRNWRPPELARGGDDSCRAVRSRLGESKVRDRFKPLGAMLLLLCPVAVADVGLPSYQEPFAEAEATAAKHRPLIKQISYGDPGVGRDSGTPLRCEPGMQANVMDLAPPADKRVDDLNLSGAMHAPRQTLEAGALMWSHTEVDIPLYINGNQSALRTGKVINQINAIGRGERLLLVSRDENYFQRLQAIRPMDKLLVETSQTVRYYQVTRASITRVGTKAQNHLSPETLTLAACYPFQPFDGTALLYVVRAQPIPAALDPSEEEQEGGYTTVNF